MNQKSTFFVVGAIFLFVAGFLLGQQELLFMSCMLLAVLFTAQAIAGYSVRGLTVSVHTPRRLYEDESAAMTIRVANPGRWPKFFVTISCRAGEGLSVEPEEGVFLPWLPPHSSTEVVLTLRGERRGAHALGPLVATSRDPVGTAVAERRLNEPWEMLVYPSFPKVEAAALFSGGSTGLEQERERHAPGRGREFHFIRPYQPGDDIRRVHWKTTARTGELSVIEPESPSINAVAAFLYFPGDSVVGSGRQTNLERAIKIAAGMAWAVLKSGGRFTIVASRKGQVLSAEARHLGQLEQVLEVLARTEPDGQSAEIARQIGRSRRGADRSHGADSILVFVGKADEALGEALARRLPGRGRTVLYLADRDAFSGPTERPGWLRRLVDARARRLGGTTEPALPLRRSSARGGAPRVIQVRPAADVATLVRRGCLVA